MAGDLKAFASDKAELLSGALKELLSSGQEYARARFGLDLGLKPELYPSWVVLSTAALGLLLLGLSWAAVCGGLLAGKKRGSPVSHGGGEPAKAGSAKPTKPEEPKRRNKKKAAEKTQSNGQPVAVAQEEVKAAPVVSKVSQPIQSEKTPGVQAPVQVKKNKKKPKTDSVKPVQHVVSNDAKEYDDGAWETKVSNREKRQQRRKDKGPEDSGSSGGLEAPKTHLKAPVPTAPTNTKKNRGSNASSSWREEPSVNGVGWTDISTKVPGQMGAMEGRKWSNMPTAPHYRVPAEPQCWTQETQVAAWSGIDGRVKTDINHQSFSIRRLNTSEPISSSVDQQWKNRTDDSEWSGFNGMAAADPSSDWNAPVEHWGNYEEPPVLVPPVLPLKEQPVVNKVSEDEKDTAEDPSGGAAKSKKKRKKKKKTDEEAASEAQVVSTAPLVNAASKAPEPPVMASKKQNLSISSSQKKSEPTVDPPKTSQKKKVRRET
ncbi:metadherin a isoform X2 [Echeneis naucrates]|uniref:metadherin a isoform X2 n=1 Tax=Echeneis naucrates TaxID=173247 RepID=UPI0011137401|nr:protein LYRIC-like isoform X2 [Echeneis naucrates]